MFYALILPFATGNKGKRHPAELSSRQSAGLLAGLPFGQFRWADCAKLLVLLGVLLPGGMTPLHAGNPNPPAYSTPRAVPIAEGQTPLLLRVGEETTLDGCLRFAVLNLTDRTGGVNHMDWATLQVVNDCSSSRRHLLVALFLLDPNGTPYGRRVWVLKRGEVLRPGRKKVERVPVPDPDNLTPVLWSIKILKVEKPSRRTRRPAPKKK